MPSITAHCVGSVSHQLKSQRGAPAKVKTRHGMSKICSANTLHTGQRQRGFLRKESSDGKTLSVTIHRGRCQINETAAFRRRVLPSVQNPGRSVHSFMLVLPQLPTLLIPIQYNADPFPKKACSLLLQYFQEQPEELGLCFVRLIDEDLRIVGQGSLPVYT